MLFHSIQFFKFFLLVYCLYICLNHRWQNRMLLIASYIFYGAWDWRFLSLIAFSTSIDYLCGLKIFQTAHKRGKKVYLFVSILTNFCLLGVFKYFNFFTANFESLLNSLGINVNPLSLNIILPVGISFYTFQSMSYTIDIYREEIKPTERFFDFALFVAFFPQLVAGPIERAKNLLPQILHPRQPCWEKFSQGCFLIYWGLFQKVYIADKLATIVDPIFHAHQQYSGEYYLLAVYAFAFQIYCDFAGYSNIARGLAKCMGIDIMVNFNFPYFATSPSEFWRRWHISLSTWLRDYLYIPLGGNRKGSLITLQNLMITMVLGGLWHGAAWTFVMWGAYHGLLLIIYRLGSAGAKKFNILQTFAKAIGLDSGRHKAPSLLRRSVKNTVFRGLWYCIKAVIFFHFVCLGWLIFRSQSMTQVYDMILGIVTDLHLAGNVSFIQPFKFFLVHIWLLLLMDIIGNKLKDEFAVFRLPVSARFAVYLGIYYALTFYWEIGGQEFIYFQF